MNKVLFKKRYKILPLPKNTTEMNKFCQQTYKSNTFGFSSQVMKKYLLLASLMILLYFYLKNLFLHSFFRAFFFFNSLT